MIKNNKRKKDLLSRKSKNARKFTNLLMTNGEKSKACKIFLNGINICKSKNLEEKKARALADQICDKAISNIESIVETRKVRIRGNNYQVPWCAHSLRRKRTAISWFISNAKNRKHANNRTLRNYGQKTIFPLFLGQELCDSFNKQGPNIQKRNGVYTTAAHNRAFARYRWW